jgi:peptide/nickel transport system substrate-binding protein
MFDSRPLSRRFGACLAIFALVASACGSSTATPTAAPATAGPTVAPTPIVIQTPADNTPTGGMLVERLGADITSWDPCVVPAATVPGTMGDVLNAVYGALVYTDTNGVVQPAMAAGLTTTDGITWTFKLRPNVKFTDGTPYDAAAVKYNFDRAADPANACTSQKWVATWKAVTVVDPLTVTVTLPSADANFNLKIAELEAFIAAPSALKAATKKADIQPVGAGPFTVGTWSQGVQEILNRNANYWDSPRPYINTLKLMTVPQSNTGQAMIVQGGMDIMMGYSYQYGTNATAPGVATKKVPINGYNIAYFITDGGTTKLFNDVNARQALVMAVDRNKMVQALTQDNTIQAPTSLYPTTSPYYDATLVYPTYDQTKAQAAIDAVIAGGKKFEFTILVPNSSDTVRAAQYLQQAMNAYKNVKANINTVEAALYNQECLAKHGDICIQPGASMWNSPEPNTFNLFSSVGSQPFAAYKSTAMDAALAKTLSAVSDADKVAAYKEVQRVFLQDLPLFQYGQQTRHMLIRDNVGGFVHGGQGQLQAQYLYRCTAKCN